MKIEKTCFLCISLLSILLLSIFLLPADARAMEDCVECHEEWFEDTKSQKVLHPPVEEDDCSSCHDHHGDDEELVWRGVASAVLPNNPNPQKMSEGVANAVVRILDKFPPKK